MKAFQELGRPGPHHPGLQQGGPGLQRPAHHHPRHGPGRHLHPGYYTDAANIAIQSRKLRITIPLLGGDGWDSAQLAGIGKEAMLNTFYSNHYSHQDPKPAVQNFITKYKERNGGGHPGRLARSATTPPRSSSRPWSRAPSLGGKDLAAAIAATKDFAGVTGSISMDEKRDARKPAVVLEMKKDASGQIIPPT
jgi:branched-chain amino acid transport system substrate-binding protein